MAQSRPIRVLLAKPGLDGHDVGAKLVGRALMEAGMEVTYTGLRKSPEAIAEAALRNEVDVIGLSILSGAHVTLCEKVAECLRTAGLGEATWIVGGVIPRDDREKLRGLGFDAVFGVGTPFEEIVDFIRGKVEA